MTSASHINRSMAFQSLVRCYYCWDQLSPCVEKHKTNYYALYTLSLIWCTFFPLPHFLAQFLRTVWVQRDLHCNWKLSRESTQSQSQETGPTSSKIWCEFLQKLRTECYLVLRVAEIRSLCHHCSYYHASQWIVKLERSWAHTFSSQIIPFKVRPTNFKCKDWNHLFLTLSLCLLCKQNGK